MSRKPILLETAHRSKLEDKIADQLKAAGVQYTYESERLPYEVPARKARYTPDFLPVGTPIILEGKGWFKSAAERQKLLLVKEQHPGRDIRLVFQNANKPIYKGSPTTYAKWATDHGLLWCDKGTIPAAWIIEMSKAQKRK